LPGFEQEGAGNMLKKRWCAFLLLGALLLGGCQSSMARSEALLATNVAGLSDGELDVYYRTLNDQIARAEGNLSPELTEALRLRRNAVRQELGLRGLRP